MDLSATGVGAGVADALGEAFVRGVAGTLLLGFAAGEER